MQTDAEIAALCAAIYDPSQIGIWEHLWDGGADSGGIYAGIKDNALIFRGSITTEDWFRDLCAYPRRSLVHPQLGPIHSGFYEGLDDFFKEALPLLGRCPVIGGHSLGAARAWLFAGQYIAQGGGLGRIAVFGSPRPGCEQLRKLLAPASKASYKNRYDPVTEVPIWLPDFPVLHMADFSVLNQKPAADDWEPLADHHIELYCRGVDNAANPKPSA